VARSYRRSRSGMHASERPHRRERLPIGAPRKHIALHGRRDVLEHEHTRIVLRVDKTRKSSN
jgi:hypothetical protein